MSDFFERIPSNGIAEFQLYTLEHFLTIFVSIAVLVGFYLISPKLKSFKYEKIIRYTIATLMLLTQVNIFAYLIEQREYWYMYLPEATCGWAIYLGAISLYTKNRYATVLTMFWGWGAISTLLLPNLLEGPSRFNFYNFFLRHILILLSSIYFYRVLNFKLYKKDFKIYFYITLSLAIMGGIISNIVNRPEVLNLFYMMQPAKNTPVLGSILEINYYLYVIVWLSLASVLGYIYGIPFYQKEKSLVE